MKPIATGMRLNDIILRKLCESINNYHNQLKRDRPDFEIPYTAKTWKHVNKFFGADECSEISDLTAILANL